ncbi:hypothetical protein AN958_00036 [Leucoagaricus sp. SymC.cos]|nr:hypothetical protein AN958_00036 [Leucoagaricus sp. SymC.cos]
MTSRLDPECIEREKKHIGALLICYLERCKRMKGCTKKVVKSEKCEGTRANKPSTPRKIG